MAPKPMVGGAYRSGGRVNNSAESRSTESRGRPTPPVAWFSTGRGIRRGGGRPRSRRTMDCGRRWNLADDERMSDARTSDRLIGRTAGQRGGNGEKYRVRARERGVCIITVNTTLWDVGVYYGTTYIRRKDRNKVALECCLGPLTRFATVFF